MIREAALFENAATGERHSGVWSGGVVTGICQRPLAADAALWCAAARSLDQGGDAGLLTDGLPAQLTHVLTFRTADC